MNTQNTGYLATSPHLFGLAATVFALFTLVFFVTPSFAQSGPVESPPEQGGDWGWFIEQSARSFNNLDHIHFGAATHMGARWRWLSFGIGSAYRPIDWSSNRRQIPVPNGETYRGQSTVGVGQQFGYVGLYLSPALEIKAIRGLEIDLPITVGQGFLGTPLAGDDRITPNGERVSEIEDFLTDGEDIAFALGFDIGLRARWFPFQEKSGQTLGLGFAAGVHLTDFIGYEGTIYDASEIRSFGASFALVFAPR